jgi:hypothetical protein
MYLFLGVGHSSVCCGQFVVTISECVEQRTCVYVCKGQDVFVYDWYGMCVLGLFVAFLQEEI